MASARDIAVKRGETVNYYRPDQFVIRSDLNARDMSTPDNVAHVEWLANEMRLKGFTSVLRCMMWEGELVLTEGHCRTTAAKLAISREWLPTDTLLPALTEPKGTSLLDLYSRQVSGNGTSKELNVEETIANVKRIMSVGKSVAEAAALVGKSVSYVNQLLEFQGAPTEVHKMVAEGKVSLKTAAETIRKKGSTEGVKALYDGLKKAAEEGRKRATPADVAPKPKKIGAELIESMITVLRSVATGGHCHTEAQSLLARIDELRGE